MFVAGSFEAGVSWEIQQQTSQAAPSDEELCHRFFF